jgi:hypothetical protein
LSDGGICEVGLVGLLEVAAWWELVVFVYSKSKRSKKKNSEITGCSKEWSRVGVCLREAG